MYFEYKQYRLYPLAIVLTSMFGTVFSPVYANEEARKQTFVVTAYYSPVPGQCCYFRGSYEEDLTFNGEGKQGADGTKVYPGMIAAPATYPFGTIIDLHGVGVGTVHDRGGRITEWGEDLHRIDLWMGTGEEGLARALQWGTRRVDGTVYPVGIGSPPPERWNLAQFDADPSVLTNLTRKDPATAMAEAMPGQKSGSVKQMQLTLKQLGYFSEATTGLYGPVTQEALAAFKRDHGIQGNGESVGSLTVAALKVAQERGETSAKIPLGLHRGARGEAVKSLQKRMRLLGFYKGRTDGVYGAPLVKAVTAYQLDRKLIDDETHDAAGRIGPKTLAAITKEWSSKLVMEKAKPIAKQMELAEKIRNERIPAGTLSKGDRGTKVRMLQSLLRDLKYLPSKDVTGTFGDRTHAALLKFQLDRKIVADTTAKGAGVFGPATKEVVVREMVRDGKEKR